MRTTMNNNTDNTKQKRKKIALTNKASTDFVYITYI